MFKTFPEVILVNLIVPPINSPVVIAYSRIILNKGISRASISQIFTLHFLPQLSHIVTKSVVFNQLICIGLGIIAQRSVEGKRIR